MSNLATTEKGKALVPVQDIQLSPDLLGQEKSIVLAAAQPKIRETDDKTILAKVTEIVTEAYFETKFKYDNTDLVATCKKFADDVVDYYPFLTLEEVRIAVRHGVRKMYGEYMGLSVVSFFDFIRGYLEERKQAILKQYKFNEEQRKRDRDVQLPEEEANGLMVEYCLKHYSSFEKGNEPSDELLASTYDFIKRHQITDFVFDKKTKEHLRKLAEARLVRKFDVLKARNKEERLHFATLVKLSLDETRQEDTPEMMKVKKALALLQFFKQVKEKKLDLETILTSKVKPLKTPNHE